MSELIVPIDVRALCVSDVDDSANKTKNNFFGTTMDFKPLSESRAIGSEIFRPFTQSRDAQMQKGPLYPLKRGVHLHWSLPRALTSGKVEQVKQKVISGQQQHEIIFPAVPNRWLVVRMVTTTKNTKSWVVESDYIHPEDTEAVTIAVNSDVDTEQKPYRCVGRAVSVADWKETLQTNNLKDLTSGPLSAVHSGEPIFAAYYPNCMNIFGLYDDLQDVSGNAELMYMVVGWFSDSSDDPLTLLKQQESLSAEEIASQYGWDLSSKETIPTVSLYNGTVQGISWKPDEDTDFNAPQIDVAIGNNPAEALATWMSGEAQENTSERDTLENLITAFQLGLFNDFANSDVDQLPNLMDKLHEAAFGTVKGGTYWTIVPSSTSNSTSNGEEETLPYELVEALSALNKAQKDYDQGEQEADSLRWQLYSDWYRHVLTTVPREPDQTLVNSTGDYLDDELGAIFEGDGDEGPYLHPHLNNLSNTLKSKKDAVQQKLGSQWQLKPTSAPHYFQAHDPVVLMTGIDLTHRFAGIDTKDLVRCRTTKQILTQLNGVSSSALGVSSLPQQLPYQRTFQSLFLEACLLNLEILNQSGISLTQKALQVFLSTGKADNNISFLPEIGLPPLSMGVQFWSGKNPFLPVVMYWNTNYEPLQTVSTASDTYKSDLISNSFSLSSGVSDPNATTFVDLVPRSTLPSTTQSSSYDGSGILNPLAIKSMVSAIKKLNPNHLPQALYNDLHNLVKTLNHTSMVFQGLCGLNDSMLMRTPTPQLEVSGLNEIASDQNSYFGDRVKTAVVDQNTHGILEDGLFSPIRGGLLEGLQIVLIDIFGQKYTVTPNTFRCSPSLRLKTTESNKQIYLAPRITQPARLYCQYLAQQGDLSDVGSVISPVCGWILPNHLENSLVFYDHNHQLIGSLYNTSGNNVIWQTAPGTNRADNIDSAFNGASPHLYHMAQFIQRQGSSFFTAFWNNIQNTAATIFGVEKKPSLAMFFGQPFAVVQASLQLEIAGRPALNQSLDVWKAEIQAVQDANEDSPLKPFFLEQRHNNGFVNVEFPLQLGNLQRAQDGLIGYFAQNEQGDPQSYDFSKFYTVGPTSGQNAMEQAKDTSVTPNGTAKKFLMLVDPRAKVHVTMGALPTVILQIPPHQYTQMLAQMELNFPICSTLSATNQVKFPFPQEPGFEWQWFADQSATASEVQLPSPHPQFNYTPQQINSGWLQLKRQQSEGS